MNRTLRPLWPLVTGTFALGLDAYVLAGLLPAMASDLNTTQANIGLGVALFTAAYAISAPLIAPALASRYSARMTLLSGIMIFIVGNLFTLFSSSLTALLLSRLIAGTGAGIYSPLTSACAAGMVEESHRGRALALILAGLSVGTALGVPAGLVIEKVMGWQATIGLIALLGIIAFVGILINNVTFPAPQAIPWKKKLGALTSGFTLMTLAVTLLTGIASLGIYTFIAEIATGKNLTYFTPYLLWSWGIGGMVGALFVGQVIDRYLSPWSTTFFLLLILVIGFAAFDYGSIYIALAGVFIWGLAGWSSIAPQQHALLNSSPDNAASLIGWNSSANYAGGSVGVLIGSFLLNKDISPLFLPVSAIAVTVLALIIHMGKLTLKGN